MSEPPPMLTYATPRRERRYSRVDWSARLLGAAQVLIALLLLVHIVTTLGRDTFSDGPWVARLAWYWFPRCAIVSNAVAAVMALSASFRLRGQQGMGLRRYLGLCLGNLAITAVAMVVLDRCRLFVSDNPLAPPVNDRRFYLDADLYVQVPILFLICNPVLVLLAVRLVLRPWADEPVPVQSHSEPGSGTKVTFDEPTAAIRGDHERG